MSSYPQRKSPRLPGYDYAREGAYFVTICQQNRACLFGDIADQELCLNPAGVMLRRWWERLPEKFPDAEIDHFVVMPNHFHGIVLLKGDQTRLSDAVGWFKAMTTNAYIQNVKEQDWTPFEKRLWQRSYYDHIIRDEQGLEMIRRYVLTNPARWNEDTFYAR
ncbi:MAG: transposase [Chloroflexi bacterium]|uniref:transposase n=1 Tax=Candidatus Flexifilum breve TaxID=3140694 RepID=UPI003134E09A|nr:transposase [Chloroflexota bacterium]